MNPTPDLIGKTVKVWYHHTGTQAPPSAKGKVIGFVDHPTVIIEDANGKQHYYSSQLRFEIVNLAPEPPTGGAVATEYSVWLRGHGGWFDGFEPDEGRQFLTWEQLNLRYEVRPLGYVPPADRTNFKDQRELMILCTCEVFANFNDPACPVHKGAHHGD